MGTFATDWLPEQAKAFWIEAVERLKRDARFQDHLHRFENAPRFFVDSKEGFRIEDVRSALLPIVTDDAHRSRIGQAQSEYVLSTAANALSVLFTYISTRSENLNRLLTEAQERADGTVTAVEELLESLESSLLLVKQRLHEARQATPSGNFAIDAIITQQAVNERQGARLRSLEGEIKESLERQLQKIYMQTWRRARRHFNARSRGWFPTKKSLDLRILSERQFDLGENRGELSTASAHCARSILQTVNQQLAAAFTGALLHLRNRSEAWAIGSSVHDIEGALGKFQSVHDDSIKGFYAYISAPNSSDLLREHGFVGFDEAGNQAVQTESINAMNSKGFVAIAESSESCKESLRSLGSEEPEDLTRTLDDEEARSIEDTAFGDRYCDDVGAHVNESCNQKVTDFILALTERIDGFVQKVDVERSDFATSRGRIWKSRATLAARFGLVTVLLVVGAFLFNEFSPDRVMVLLSMLTDNVLETILVGSASTVLVLSLVFIVTGAKNEIVRQSLRPVLYERWIFYTKCRSLRSALNEYFDESYGAMINELKEAPLEIDAAISNGISKSLRQNSDSYQQAEEALDELWKVVDARSKLFDEYIEVVNQRMEGIPKELRETADGIKKDAIEKHMGRIRNAASSVEQVKSQVQRIADIAMQSS